MAKKITGIVVGKDFQPPSGSEPSDWCYLTIAVSDSERLTIRIAYESVPKVGVGDVVKFAYRGKHRRHRVRRIGSGPGSAPTVGINSRSEG